MAWLGLVLAPLATPAGAMAAKMGMVAEAVATDMPEGMPCCPDSQKKPDCAKDCPLMAMCAAKVFAGFANAGVAAPLSFGTLIVPGDAAKLSGFAQAPPPRPPKA